MLYVSVNYVLFSGVINERNFEFFIVSDIQWIQIKINEQTPNGDNRKTHVAPILFTVGTSRSILRSSKVYKYTSIYRSILLYISNLLLQKYSAESANLMQSSFMVILLQLGYI